jgi:hypothetical protein
VNNPCLFSLGKDQGLRASCEKDSRRIGSEIDSEEVTRKEGPMTG